MNRICLALLVTAACGRNLPGTQIGVEHGACDGTSETVVDTTTIPDGFTRSVDDLGEQVLGSFSGPLLDGAGASTGNDATLDVTLGEGDIVLHRYEPQDTVGGPDISFSCQDAMVLPLTLSLVHPDFSWAGTAELRVSEDGSMTTRVDVSDPQGFPSPTTFDRDADYTWFTLDMSIDGDTWRAEGIWHFENAEFERGNDSVAYTTETVLLAEMSADE